MLSKLKQKLEERLFKDKYFVEFEDLPHLEFTPPPAHIDADISLAWAMGAAKKIKKNPLDIAKKAAKTIESLEEVATCSLTAPGFLNIKLTDAFLVEAARDRRLKNRDAVSNAPERKILIEFVSANPTGPLHVASGRGASLGDSLVKIHRALGVTCDAEYYINDAGNQAELLGISLQARAEGKEPPENGYHGQYLADLAKQIPAGMPKEDYGRFAMEELIKTHQEDMKDFRVEFTRWFRESELHNQDAPMQTLAFLKKTNSVYEKDGAVWFGTSEDRDDKDRVLVRTDGRPTYFLADIAYHKNKFDRGYARLIDIWGADHHGYVPRMQAAIKALGHDEDKDFTAIIHQLVHLIENGEKVKMSKRAGTFITLRELMKDVGTDACRFFFASRTPNAHLNFDLSLAKKRTNENPVFYVQYVHARIASIFNSAQEKNLTADNITSPLNLAPQERALLSKMLWFKTVLLTCAKDLSPHHLTSYLTELAGLFHSFYDSCRVLDENNGQLTKSRLFTCLLAQQRIQKGLELIGVTAPQKM